VARHTAGLALSTTLLTLVAASGRLIRRVWRRLTRRRDDVVINLR
jgi:hypothetical protein